MEQLLTIKNTIDRANKQMYMGRSETTTIIDVLKPLSLTQGGATFVLTSIPQQIIKDPLCLHMYENGVREHVRSFTFFAIIKVLLNNPDIRNPFRASLFDMIEQIFDEPASTFTIKSEAADVMHTYWPVRAERLLNDLREQYPDDDPLPAPPIRRDTPGTLAAIRITPPRPPKPPKKTLYSDSQNVHNNTINNSVITAIKRIIKMHPPVIRVNNTCVDVYNTDTLNDLLVRIADRFDSAPEYLLCKLDDINDLPENVEVIDKLRCTKNATSMAYNKVMYKDMVDVHVAFNNVLLATPEPIKACNASNIPNAKAYWNDRKNIVERTLKAVAKTKAYVVTKNDRVKDIITTLFPFEEIQKKLVRRVKESTIRGIEMSHLLISVWSFIQAHEHKDELIKRLKEEIVVGQKVCTSGLCARIISSIQGFFDVDKHPLLCIKMSVDDELTGKIFTLVNKECVKAEIDPAFDKDFPKLLETVIKEHSKDLIREYDEIFTEYELLDFAKNLYHVDKPN